jgi:hypothetical protein
MEHLLLESNTLVFYIDDTGDEQLNNPEHPVFAFGGVACSTALHLELARSWQTMKSRHFPQVVGPLHAKTHLRESKLSKTKREAVLAAIPRGTLGRFGTIMTADTMVGRDQIMITTCGTLANRLARVAAGMAQLGLWNPSMSSRKVIAVFEHSARLANHLEQHFTSLALQVLGETIPVEGCFMLKSVANPFLEMADFVVNTVGRNVKHQRIHGRQSCIASFHSLFRDVGPPMADYFETTTVVK